MKNVLVIIALFFMAGCTVESTPKDLQPIIDGRFKDAKAVYYPSTDFKVVGIVVDKTGDVWFLRMNATDELRDEKLLFNINQFKAQ